MINLNVKPQNRDKIFIIFILGGIWGIIDMGRFKGVMAFAIDGGLLLIVAVILGNITNYVFRTFGFDPWNRRGQERADVLDVEQEVSAAKQSEDQKDRAALVYGIIWALLFVLLSLF